MPSYGQDLGVGCGHPHTEDTMKTEIDMDFIAGCEKAWKKDKKGQMISNAIIKNGFQLAAMNYEAIRKLPFTFSVDVWDGNVTDQVESLRCWAFASLNNVRQHAIENMDMADKGFELSQDYIYFYDQVNRKCEYAVK